MAGPELGTAGEQIADLLIGRLREILIPDPDCVEWLRRHRADDVIRLLAHRVARLGRRDRDGTTMRAGPRCRNALTAATIVAPVARPSSTRITVRPRISTGGRLPRYRRSRRASSSRSRAVTVSITSRGMRTDRTSDSFRTRTSPVAMAPIATSA